MVAFGGIFGGCSGDVGGGHEKMVRYISVRSDQMGFGDDDGGSLVRLP